MPKSKKIEHKQLSFDKCEIKMQADGSLRFEGYASKFEGLDWYGDTIEAGTFTQTLKDREKPDARPIALRWNHWGPIIGKLVEIYEDDIGLRVIGELTPGHSVAEDVAASLKHKAISGLSIGFYLIDFEETNRGRIIKEVELIEISIVEDPADMGAQIESVKSALTECKSLKDIETILRREFGLSQQASTVIVSSVKNLVKHGDRAQEDALKYLKDFNLNL